MIIRLRFGSPESLGIPEVIFNVIRKRVLYQCTQQGYGLHSEQELYKIGQSDLKALEDFLEQRQYFFGEEISMLDIEVFAFTTQVLFYDKGEFNLFLKDSCPSLVRHFHAIRCKCFPEWDLEPLKEE